MIHWIYIAGFVVMYIASARLLWLSLDIKDRRHFGKVLLCLTPILNSLIIAVVFIYFMYVLIKEIWLERDKLTKNKD